MKNTDTLTRILAFLFIVAVLAALMLDALALYSMLAPNLKYDIPSARELADAPGRHLVTHLITLKNVRIESNPWPLVAATCAAAICIIMLVRRRWKARRTSPSSDTSLTTFLSHASIRTLILGFLSLVLLQLTFVLNLLTLGGDFATGLENLRGLVVADRDQAKLFFPFKRDQIRTNFSPLLWAGLASMISIALFVVSTRRDTNTSSPSDRLTRRSRRIAITGAMLEVLLVIPALSVLPMMVQRSDLLARSPHWEVRFSQVKFVSLIPRSDPAFQEFGMQTYTIEPVDSRPTRHLGIWLRFTALEDNSDSFLPEVVGGDTQTRVACLGTEDVATGVLSGVSLHGLTEIRAGPVDKGDVRHHIVVLECNALLEQAPPGSKFVLSFNKFYDLRQFKARFQIPTVEDENRESEPGLHTQVTGLAQEFPIVAQSAGWEVQCRACCQMKWDPIEVIGRNKLDCVRYSPTAARRSRFVCIALRIMSRGAHEETIPIPTVKDVARNRNCEIEELTLLGDGEFTVTLDCFGFHKQKRNHIKMRKEMGSIANLVLLVNMDDPNEDPKLEISGLLDLGPFMVTLQK